MKRTSQKKPKVSVVILNFNGKRFLHDVLSTILHQTYPDYEVILVDNASTDGSVEYVKQNFPSVRIVRNLKNYGFAEGNNIGARHARGKYVIFLNNDTRVSENFIEELIKTLEGDPQVAAVGCAIASYNGKIVNYEPSKLDFLGRPLKVKKKKLKRADIREAFGPTGVAFAVRKDTFFKAGGLDPKYFLYWEETDLGWRLQLLGYRILLTPKTVVYHVGGGTVLTFYPIESVFFYSRNKYFTFIKNLAFMNLIKIGLANFSHDLFFVLLQFPRLLKRIFIKPKPTSAPSPVVKVRVYYYFMSFLDVIRHLPYLLIQRRKIQKSRKVSDEEIISKFFSFKI